MIFCRVCKAFLLGLPVIFALASCSTQPSQDPNETSAGSSAPLTALTVIAEEPPEIWHYVALGGGTVNTGGASEESLTYHYKAMLEEDLGVQVELHDWSFRHGGTSKLLTMLQIDEALREQMRSADVVTIQVPMDGLEWALRGFDQGPEVCDEACLEQAFAEYKTDAEQVFDAILSLVDPTETVIRAQDTYLWNATYLKETGTFDIYNHYWWDAQEYIHRLGEVHRIPVAAVYREFMGPDGSDDPADKGWVMDITNPNEEGARVMAQLIRELGYEYATK